MLAKIPAAVTESTLSRRNTVRELVEAAVQRHPKIDAIRILYFFRAAYPNPATACAYVNTAVYLYPRLKRHPEWKDHMKTLTKDSNLHVPFAAKHK